MLDISIKFEPKLPAVIGIFAVPKEKHDLFQYAPQKTR